MTRIALAVLVCILVFQGTYFRHRDTIAVPTVDWLILARLSACAAAFVVGTVLISRKVSWGFGGKSLLFYVLATGISAVNSPYFKTVAGYFILLLGASTLMLALVYRARSIAQLERIQKIWFLTVGVLVVKDALTAMFFVGASSSAEQGRLGMGVTHATELSLFAALLFWMSFDPSKGVRRIVLWLWRIFLLYVIIAAKSRVPIAGFTIAGLFYAFFSMKHYLKRGLLIGCTGFLAALLMFGLVIGQNWAGDMSKYMKRGQDTEEFGSFTGRTYIWQHILQESRKSPIAGNGYGVSRLTMGKVPNMNWEPPHCHNEALEVLFNTGILGFIPFLAMIVYNLKWIVCTERLQRTFSKKLALNAMCLAVMLILSFMFEVRLSGKLSPIQPLFLFYLMILDREDYFLALKSTQQFTQESLATSTARSNHRPQFPNRDLIRP